MKIPLTSIPQSNRKRNINFTKCKMHGPNCLGPNCGHPKSGQLGPGAQLSGAQLSTPKKRTVGPRTVEPCPGPNCPPSKNGELGPGQLGPGHFGSGTMYKFYWHICSQNAGSIYQLQIYNFRNVHTPTLRSKDAQKPFNLYSSPKCWHDISNTNI